MQVYLQAVDKASDAKTTKQSSHIDVKTLQIGRGSWQKQRTRGKTEKIVMIPVADWERIIGRKQRFRAGKTASNLWGKVMYSFVKSKTCRVVDGDTVLASI